MTKLVNCTPHTINLPGQGIEIPASGQVARVKTTSRASMPVQGIEVTEEFQKGIEGLPPSEPGVVYIVSRMVAAYAGHDRLDLVSPGNLVRDDQGRINGCGSFVAGEGYAAAALNRAEFLASLARGLWTIKSESGETDTVESSDGMGLRGGRKYTKLFVHNETLGTRMALNEYVTPEDLGVEKIEVGAKFTIKNIIDEWIPTLPEEDQKSMQEIDELRAGVLDDLTRSLFQAKSMRDLTLQNMEYVLETIKDEHGFSVYSHRDGRRIHFKRVDGKWTVK